MRKIYLWPASLAVIYLASIIIIISPIRNQNILPMPTPAPVKYECPATEWVDCMPSPDGTSLQCRPEYLKWAKDNCPNFKGAAL